MKKCLIMKTTKKKSQIYFNSSWIDKTTKPNKKSNNNFIHKSNFYCRHLSIYFLKITFIFKHHVEGYIMLMVTVINVVLLIYSTIMFSVL